MDNTETTAPRVLVFAGSTRTDSLNRKLAQEAFAELDRAGVPATLADLRDYPMPLYDGDSEATTGLPPQAKAFKELLRTHEAFVIVTPEYNGSFPALVKNVIDWTSRAEAGEKPLAVWRGKTVALLSASPGPGGGVRGLRHSRELLEMIGVKVVPEPMSLPRASEAFDSQGKLTRSEDRLKLETLISELGKSLGILKATAA